jgi:hypothetical protein
MTKKINVKMYVADVADVADVAGVAGVARNEAVMIVTTLNLLVQLDKL